MVDYCAVADVKLVLKIDLAETARTQNWRIV